MAIITVTAQANEKNTRTVSTAKGDKKIISVPLFEKEKGSNVKIAYGSAFLPDFIKLGDTVTISGRVQAKESGEYVNYNFVFPTVEKLTSMDVNKAIQRGLVKAIARHGLGLYIYANEDLPDLTEEQKELEAEKQRLREIQPLIKRAEQLGYQNIDSLKDKTKKEITDIMTIWLAQQEAEKGE